MPAARRDRQAEEPPRDPAVEGGPERPRAQQLGRRLLPADPERHHEEELRSHGAPHHRAQGQVHQLPGRHAGRPHPPRRHQRRERDPEQHERLDAILSSIMGRSVTIEETIDESILAGLVIRLENVVLDGSLKTKLNGMLAYVQERLAR